MDGLPLTPRVPRATLEKLRSVVRDCLEKHLDDSAVFFADKLVSMSGDGDARDPDDLFLYCQALFAGKHHRRALTVMRGEGLVDGGDVPARDVPAVRKNAPRFRLLAARCLAATREWDECLAALGDGDGDESSAADEEESSFSDERTKKISSASAIALLRAQAHEALENRPLARRWYVAALAADPFCYAALEALVANHALSAEEERALIDSLAFDPEDEWLRFLYTSMGKKYDEPAIESGLEMLEEIAGSGSSADEPSGAAPVNETSDEARARRERLAALPAELLALRDNGDVALARAEWYYHRGDFKK